MGRVETWRGPSGPSEKENDGREQFTAESFLNCLRRSNSIWNPHFGQFSEQHWVYRGHSDERWQLVPSAARKNRNRLQYFIDYRLNQINSNEDWCKYLEINQRTMIANFAAYADALRYFVKLGNDVGLLNRGLLKEIFSCPLPSIKPIASQKITLTMKKLIVQGTFAENGEVVRYPGAGDSLAALAQHHGIPTFLLDWSKSPWTAAHFASEDARGGRDDTDICVWAFNYAEAKRIRNNSHSLGLGTVEINEPPKADNLYLAKQDGILTYLTNDCGEWERTGNFPSMESIVAKWTVAEARARIGSDVERWAALESQFGKDLKEERTVLRKLVLKKQHLPELRQLLRREGVTRAHLKPTLDNIAKTALEIAEDDLKAELVAPQ